MRRRDGVRPPYIRTPATPVGRKGVVPTATRTGGGRRRNLASLSDLPPPRATQTEARTTTKTRPGFFFSRSVHESVSRDLLIGRRHGERAVPHGRHAHLLHIDRE